MATIEDVQERWPQWRIERVGNMTMGWIYIGRPKAEEIQPPIFSYDQLHRGLRTHVEHPDIRELERRIEVQDRYRRELTDAGEHPFNGRTYVEVERTLAAVPDDA